MLTEQLMNIGLYVFSIGLALINVILTPVLSLINVPYSGAVGASYIFGNLGLFNTVLPISEILVFVGIALTLKGIVFGYKVFWAVTSIASHFVNRFIKFKA